MKKQLLFAFGAAALLASCSNDIDTPQVSQDGQLHVNAAINQIRTRATDDQWAAGDKIGVSDDKGNSNVAYVTAAGNGKDFTAVTDGIVLKGNDTYTFTAYYPYDEELAESGVIDFDVVDSNNAQVSLPTIDFMFAEKVTATRKNPEIDLQFAHKMTKLAFTFTNVDGGIAQGATISYTLDNVVTAGTFNAKSGEVTPSTNPTKNQVKADATLNTVSNVILPSFTSGAEAITIYLTVTDGDKEDNYSGEIQPELLAGNQYNYTLDIVYGQGLKIKSGNITNWSPVTGEGALNPSDQTAPEKPYEPQVGDFLLNDGSILAANSEEFSDKESDIVGIVFFVGNPCPTNAAEYDDSKDVLFNDFYKTTFEYTSSDEIETKYHGLAIALENVNGGDAIKYASAKYKFMDNWANVGDYSANVEKIFTDNLSVANAPTAKLGYNNTKALKLAQTDLSSAIGCDNLLSYIAAFQTKYSVSNASDWFVPSYLELLELVDNEEVQTSFEKLSGFSLTTFADYTKEDKDNKFYWSSDMYNDNYNWCSTLETNDDPRGNLRNYRTQNSGYLRLAIAF